MGKGRGKASPEPDYAAGLADNLREIRLSGHLADGNVGMGNKGLLGQIQEVPESSGQLDEDF